MAWNVVDRGIVLDGVTDNTAALAKLSADLKALSDASKPLPRVVFPEGICAFNTWSNLALPHLQLIAEGQCVLKHTGTGDAVTFDGNVMRPTAGSNHILIDGNFVVLPNVNSHHGVVFKGIHRSFIRMLSVGCGAPISGAALPNAAFYVAFSVASEFDCKATTWNLDAAGIPDSSLRQGAGLLIDDMPIPPGGSSSIGPTTNCLFHNPCFENMGTGIFVNRGNGNVFMNGVCEGCTVGVHLDHNSGYNKFLCMDLEANSQYDCQAINGAHSNIFWNNSNTDGWKTNLTGWNNRVAHSPLDGLFGM